MNIIIHDVDVGGVDWEAETRGIGGQLRRGEGG